MCITVIIFTTIEFPYHKYSFSSQASKDVSVEIAIIIHILNSNTERFMFALIGFLYQSSCLTWAMDTSLLIG